MTVEPRRIWQHRDTDGSSCPGCRERSERVAERTAQVAELTRKLGEAVRAGDRQAPPFRTGPPKPDPKLPGRKSGDAHGTHGHRPLLPPMCRFQPGCSEYFILAVKKHGPLYGCAKGAWRICRCNPWGGSGYDPP